LVIIYSSLKKTFKTDFFEIRSIKHTLFGNQWLQSAFLNRLH
jgi:hypothetical protein